MAIKGDCNLTYAFSRVDMEVKTKFRGSFSKVHDWKANFVVVKKFFLSNATEFETLTPWGFTTYWGEILAN